ncbi:DUF4434 family protein [Franconibacter helveticus]|uniref:DUF4434 family protein n=1 Tax=Franconibacter helveticus TaxID=357240 RepID=UPI00066CB137|nr:DUF4434 family protein [Franconibacter helveticus]
MIRLFSCLLALILFSAPSFAMQGIFWQPQLRDNAVSDAQWLSLMQTLRQQQFDAVVIQWTRYGEAFQDEKARAPLVKKAQAAQQAGLKVILGLYADPDFFNRQKQPPAALANYLNRLLAQDLAQAKLWMQQPGFKPDGWYISAEIDDHNWREQAARVPMLTWLREAHRLLTSVADKPVYISSFFAGNMSPEGYNQLLAGIKNTGVKVLVQDGGGTGKLSAAQREIYINRSAGCEATASASGIVYEIFTANPGRVFSARPKPRRQIESLLKMHSPCAKDHFYFSLRYLPAAENILRHD